MPHAAPSVGDLERVGARYTCTAFACEVSLAVVGEPRRPFEEAADWLHDLDGRFSRFRSGNELSALNGCDGRWISVSGEMERLLTWALTVAVASSGLVNVAVTQALRRAGYVRSWPEPWHPAPGAGGCEPVPPLTELLEVRDGRARLAPGHAVDFGALAKGLWADDVAESLGENAAVSIGGDVSARGPGPAGEGWPIGLPTGRTALVRDGGVATSGSTKRRSGPAHHIIDPRTGRPAVSPFGEASVVAGCAADAEWLATSLLVDGDEGARLVAGQGAAYWVVPASTEEEHS